MIAKLWAEKVMNQEREFEDVPAKLIDNVKVVLAENGYSVENL